MKSTEVLTDEELQRLFAALAPWIRSQIKRYEDIWDGSIQYRAEDLTQTFRMLLWESIVEWDREKAHSPTFCSNPTGVIIRKTQAKIRRWYQQERRRYWIERALIQDYDDESMSLEEYVGGWRKEAEQAVTPNERGYARTVVKILSTIGEEYVQKRRRSAELASQELREMMRKADSKSLRVAVRQGVLTEDEAKLLATERIRASEPRIHSRLRQRRHRARRRYEKWVNSAEAQEILVREGLLNVEGACYLLALASHFTRQIAPDEIDDLRQYVMALPGAKETWDRMDATGILPEDIDYDYDDYHGCFTWEDVGFPEGDGD